MLAAVERAHPATTFDPDAEVFDFGIDGAAGGQQLPDVPPIDADEMQRAVAAERRQVGADLAEKRREFGGVHLAGCHWKRPVVDRAEPADMTVDRHVIRGIGEDQHHQALEYISAARQRAAE